VGNSQKIKELVKKHTSRNYITYYFRDLDIHELYVYYSVFRPDESFSGQYLAHVLKAHPELYKDKDVLDMGCGTGLLGIVCGLNNAKSIFFTDLNPKAEENAIRNAKLLKIKRFLSSHGNLFEGVGRKKFDVIIFNPPGFSGEARNYIEATLVSENKTIESFFRKAPLYLKKDGVIVVPTSTVHDKVRSPVTWAKILKYNYKIIDKKPVHKVIQFAVVIRPYNNNELS
jgi:methylase of polypeptide subunit release factors